MKNRRDWPGAPQSIYIADSFDGAISLKCAVQKPDRYSFFGAGTTTHCAIARGAGLSYAAASFGGDAISVDMSSFDRVLAFCDKTGIVEVEAGIRLGDLYNFLIRRNFYLPIQPGHGRISIGGCIAADVHGKNPFRDGTFAKQVQSVKLFHPDHGIVNLSETAQPALFRATCGGYGTTGIIISAQLRCVRVPGNAVEVHIEKVASVNEGVLRLRSLAHDSDFVYSWHDLTLPSAQFGRGHVVVARFVNVPITRPSQLYIPQLLPNSRERWPVGVYTFWTARAINAAHAATRGRNTKHVTLDQSLFPIHGSEHYFSAFGKKGFHEFQAIVPHDSFGEYIAGIRAATAYHSVTITLAAAKIFAGTSTLIRFDGDGVCFTINFPRSQRSPEFMHSLDQLLLEVGGRPNPIKDSRLPRHIAEAAYPELPHLRSVLHSWDKSRMFRSELSVRLGL
ncbi:MAG TPA: FAD-binding oxidoreductase [Steroidobacteraceae bacterium]|jgi:decaprenylphospho-beta-D-ribofuranose 2-oxidase|nr:FAD-binding oxidoreductase [Steroidobacteraceae bacterium]